MGVMKRNWPIILFILILSFSPVIEAKEKDPLGPSEVVEKLRSKGYSIQYIDDEVSVVEMAKTLKEEKSNLYYLELADIVKNLKRWNRHVKTFTNLKGEYIYTESPADPYLSYEYIPQLPLNQREPERRLASIFVPETIMIEENNLDYTELSQRRYTFFAHVTVSQGFFNEQVNESVLENQQNSPLTVGTGAHVRFSDQWAVASSVYFSKLNASIVDTAELDQSELVVNDEIGGNLYLEYKLADASYSFYGGLDYEQFTTLNLDEIISGNSNKINTNKEKMGFATVGVSFFKKLFLPSTIKLSASPVVHSNTGFGGYKYMFYINQRITDNTWYHFLLKHHELEQESRSVSITRYGFGVGVTF